MKLLAGSGYPGGLTIFSFRGENFPKSGDDRSSLIFCPLHCKFDRVLLGFHLLNILRSTYLSVCVCPIHLKRGIRTVMAIKVKNESKNSESRIIIPPLRVEQYTTAVVGIFLGLI